MIELLPGVDQTAISDALIQHGDVYLAPGIFPCTAPLRVPSGVYLHGPGTLRLVTDGVGYDALTSENYPDPGGSDGAVIEHIRIDGNSAIMTGAGSSNVFYGSSKLRFLNVTIKNMAGTGLLARGTGIRAIGLRIEGCAVDGFCAYDGSLAYVRDCIAISNTGYGFALMGAEVDGQAAGANGSIRGCEAAYNGTGIAALSDTYRSAIAGNLSHHNRDYGVLLAGLALTSEHNVNDVLVEGNHLSYNGLRNIMVGGAPGAFVDYATIIGNHCQDAPFDVEINARSRNTYGRANRLRGGLLNNGTGTDWQ